MLFYFVGHSRDKTIEPIPRTVSVVGPHGRTTLVDGQKPTWKSSLQLTPPPSRCSATIWETERGGGEGDVGIGD